MRAGALALSVAAVAVGLSGSYLWWSLRTSAHPAPPAIAARPVAAAPAEPPTPTAPQPPAPSKPTPPPSIAPVAPPVERPLAPLVELPSPPPRTTTPSGLSYDDLTIGTGARPYRGQSVKVHYTGWIYVDGVKGAQIDSSLDRGEPIVFPVGNGVVIKGWDEGVASMNFGGVRRLIIPPELGYGVQGQPPTIPANATLVFEVTLLEPGS